MRLSRLVGRLAVAAVAFALPYQALADDTYSFRVPAFSAGHENVLKISYELDCSATHGKGYHAVRGRIELDNPRQIVRFDMFEGVNGTELLVPPRNEETVAKLTLEANPFCLARRFAVELSSAILQSSPSALDYLALQHAPFLVVRSDQYDNRGTDIPLALAYDAQELKNGGIALRYTMYMSDEDSTSSVGDEEGQMARYGRHTDIEWLYKIELDSNLNVTRREYQGDVFSGIGHSTKTFKGKLLGTSTHPVLYDIANHNVFDDGPRGDQKDKPLEGYALVPRVRIPAPLARESLMFALPWLYRVSDWELDVENKLRMWANEYLFVLVTGVLDKGAFRARLTTAAGQSFESGGGHSDVDRLGEDMWGRQSYTAIPLGEALVDQVETGQVHGALDLVSTATWGTRLTLTAPLRFFRLRNVAGSYETVEVVNRFSCSGGRLEGGNVSSMPVCQF